MRKKRLLAAIVLGVILCFVFGAADMERFRSGCLNLQCLT